MVVLVEELRALLPEANAFCDVSPDSLRTF